MFKPNFLSRIVILFSMTIMLSGCWDVLLNDPLFKNLIADESGGTKKVQDFLRTDTGSSLAVKEYVYGEDMSFLPDNYIDDVTKDRESLMTKVLGTMFWRYDVSYSTAVNAGLTGVDEATFNYYKGAGGAWITSLRTAPGNADIAQRLELYKSRLGRNHTYYAGKFGAVAIRDLLKDDDAFALFLTDDTYAVRWLNNNPSADRSGIDKTKVTEYELKMYLGPATSAVLPNASP
ncbi:hypothetical protein [Rhizobium sp. C4]|uniref:hypothetical protein n=1 Tax=Rhizobium sp. C4 TaxID=1349800 RepID=UPI001E5D701B|nr:hypothetical protein [Rhizobium sp. C4]MCD2176031.1 hypothetical protein [Rhizobium sp. C4]